MQPQIELSFVWRRQSIKESIIAVTKAVGVGFNTKEKLTACLPQFSIYRIALAIDALITAGMAENNLGVLSIHPDMDIVFELADSKLVLPLTVDEADASMRRVIINKLGSKNPAGVESLLHAKIMEA
ncbi:conserved hypothetical protein [Candidatus Methylobacter favarea]|uniref:Uncharacterized protein n=1 Tax=Candidatus Methylobacter favarea TaxID=2707345 RepID=A0A8S0WIQ5_9GAMM|nr:hypothetical protein [Candidatus Methylobacter favarea]CAA9890674.1 conserved hypothetical protein [Candidatus Methylobacter favarea]